MTDTFYPHGFEDWKGAAKPEPAALPKLSWGPTWAPDSKWIVIVTAPGEPLCEVGPFESRAAATEFAAAHREGKIFTQVTELLGPQGVASFWKWLRDSGRSESVGDDGSLNRT